ncbi:cardiolipin synthase [Nocardioides marmoriginsengisoli]|uniref:Cardiolipin synthase n=1 Tax=Nocardioides marmoriginsengisoli TaxID=661483 RepID=A0A3N0CIZ5_9ACTN|nr:cardiolipin synthase [Nocardioides marmoriginsengisoli]
MTLLGVILAALGLTARVVALGVIPGGRRPSTGMAWLLLVLLSPLIGLVAFWFFGSNHVGKSRRRRLSEVNERIRAATAAVPEASTDLRPSVLGVTRLNRTLTSLPVTPGNAVTVLEDYRGSITEMAAAVRAAREYVHVEFYITAWDEVTEPLLDALAEAAERGVEVRLLFDHLGSRGIPGYQDLLTRLDATGIRYHPMLPIEPLRGRFRRPDLRNHRKLLVVDGSVGFTGSQNLTEPGYNKPKNHKVGRAWVELMVRLEGPVVAELDAVFASDWLLESGEPLEVRVRTAPGSADVDAAGVLAQVVPSGPGYDTENNLRMFTSLIYAAERRISLTSPYFVPDESLLYAVTTAAQRGVEVELFVSEESDQFMVGHAQSSYYRALLEAGITVRLYPAPYVLHSKHFTIDDDVAVIGSSNMDLRSFALNYEVSLLMLGEDVVRRMRTVEDHYRSLSRTLTLDEWSRRPARLKYLDNVMRLTAALQ